MVARVGRDLVSRCATAATLVLIAASGVQAQTWHKSTGKLSVGNDAKKVFQFETLNSGLCISQPNPQLVIYPDGHQEFTTQVRSTGANDTYQAYVRYFNSSGSFLTEVKWWQLSMPRANVWHPWKVNWKPDDVLSRKYKDIRKVVFNYKC